MEYKIEGQPFPVVICNLREGEAMKTQAGGMNWMSPNMVMATQGTSISKSFGRMMSGAKVFQNTFTAKGGDGMIAFAASFPGSILPIEISASRSVVVQRHGFLASEMGVELSTFWVPKVSTGLFSGEGLAMQQLTGDGIAFIEINGATVEYTLQEGQELILNTGTLAMCDTTCSFDIQQIAGVKNKLLGGEGLFNTVVRGPGRILVQTMPLAAVANAISPYIQSS